MHYNRDKRLTKSDLVLWIWVAAATVLLLVPLPFEDAARHWPALVGDLENFGHPVVAAWLTHLALKRLPWLWVLALVTGYGAAIEVIQSITGRDASGLDLLNDVLGAGFTLLLHVGSGASSPIRRRALIALGVLTGLATIAPLSMTVAAYVNRWVQAPVLWNDRSALRKRFSYWQGGEYPGLVVGEPLPDWRKWRFLEIELQNLQPEVLPIIVRVHDRKHDQSHSDRYNGQFTLPPQSRETLRIPLELIRAAPATRQMDMGAVQGIIVFSSSKPGLQTPLLHISEIRLAR